MTAADVDLDAILHALNAEGFSLPYMARSRDYLPEDTTGWDAARRAEAIAALRAADDEAWRQNRDALRRALAAHAPSATTTAAVFEAHRDGRDCQQRFCGVCGEK